MKNSDFCYMHNPETQLEAKSFQRKGGKHKVYVINPENVVQDKRIKFDNATDVREFLTGMINDVMQGKIDVRVCTSINYLLNTVLKSLEISEIEKKLKELENKVGIESDNEADNILNFTGW